MRFLGGNKEVFDSVHFGFEKERRKKTDGFIREIKSELGERYSKLGPEVFIQEPNLKENAGGIRDFHTALWLAHAKHGCRTLEELHDASIISSEEMERVDSAYDFLWRTRFAAHFLTQRKTDHLSLELQVSIARELGYQSNAYLRASESFMRDYYGHARELNRFCHAVLARTAEPPPKKARWWLQRSAGTQVEPLSLNNGQVHPEGDLSLFTENPLAIMEAFALAQAARADFSQSMREAARLALPRVDREFRESPKASSAFMNLLRRKGRVGFVLRLMHDLGFLGRFLPEFDRISLLIQHDQYHHYTVDEHTLRAIDALDKLYTLEDKPDGHLRIVLDEVEDPALLYLSLLLHDIGKGRGRGHIPRGVKISGHICSRLRLNPTETTKVLSLVHNHVAMAQLAQRRDLNDPQVATEFAEELGTLDILNMLLLLTYADLHGVGPGVWSEWKGNLLWELYRRTRIVLTGSDAEIDEAGFITRFKEQVAASLNGLMPFSQVERHLALLPNRYMRVTRPEAVATHLNLIERLNLAPFSLRWVQHDVSSTELTFCARDRHGLFADITGVLASHGIEILTAEINTREDGFALDVLMLREAATGFAIDAHRYKAIERGLGKAISGETDVAALVEKWRTRHAPRRKARSADPGRDLPRIVCDNVASRAATIVEVQTTDEPGLAYKIARVLADARLDIVCARIATEKSDALDVFYVTDEDGMKLSERDSQMIETALAAEFLPHRRLKHSTVAS
jgi:[protein-PII] uridylyltransferase